MSYSVLFHADQKIIETRFGGNISLGELKHAFSEALLLAKEHDTILFLNNFLDATIALTVIDIFQLPEILSSIAASHGFVANSLKRAFVISPDLTRDSKFAEDVSFNRGHAVRSFLDIHEAMDWLSST